MRHNASRSVSYRALLGALAVASITAGCGGDDDPSSDASTETGDVASDGADVGTDSDADAGDDVGDGSGADADLGDTEDVEVDSPDGSIDGFSIPGLSAAANVAIDVYGIPHVSCATDADCAAVLGYLHARDRFAQMDIRRRVTTGRLHQLVGALALDVDQANRNLYATPDGRFAEDVLLENASADTRALLEAYANGVNAWLSDREAGRNGAVLPDEYGFALVSADVIPPWTPADSLSTVLALIDNLTNDSDRELALGEAYASMPAEMAADLWGPAPAIESIIEPGFVFPKAGHAPATPGLDVAVGARLRAARPAIHAALERVRGSRILRDFDLDGAQGSNNWVVSPALTADGAGLLSNDPHLGLSNPAVWYYAHLDSKTNGGGDYHVAGQSFAGMPWIVIGHNEHIAWGATNTTLDQSDVYVETLTPDGTGVMFDGAEVPFVRVPHTFEPSDGPPETRDLLFVPHHGPVLELDAETGTAISLAWTGNRVTTDANFLTELMRASTVAEGRTACEQITTIGQNWVIVDTEGSIGWFPYNHVPRRDWASIDLPSFLPLPGDGSAEWGEWLPYSALPQLYNPEQGYIATANNDMTGALSDGDPFNDGTTPLQVYVDSGYRHARIVELLEAGRGSLDPDAMQDIVGDVFSAFGRDITPRILELLGDIDLAGASADVADALRAWDYECPSGVDGDTVDSPPVADAGEAASSIGCAAFHAVVGQLVKHAFGDELAANEAPMGADLDTLVRLLLRPESLAHDAWWDDVSTDGLETAQDTVIAATIDAADLLVTRLGDDPDGWRWGYLHTVTLRADLFDSFGVAVYNNGPWVNNGGTHTVDVAAPRSLTGGDFTHSAGASTRFVCHVATAGVDCTVQMPGGQRHYRDSPNYQDGLLRWLHNEPVALGFDYAAEAATAAEQLRFEVGE
ncbi:MAG: penicillin acylase family protein [Myxococcales bacterium]|nr:penicillin acylase family protein [Myxococcales bacterium]